MFGLGLSLKIQDLIWIAKYDSPLISARHNGSLTQVNDLTRVKIFGDSDLTRDTLRKIVTRLEFLTERLDSSHNQ